MLHRDKWPYYIVCDSCKEAATTEKNQWNKLQKICQPENDNIKVCPRHETQIIRFGGMCKIIREVCNLLQRFAIYQI